MRLVASLFGKGPTRLESRRRPEPGRRGAPRGRAESSLSGGFPPAKDGVPASRAASLNLLGTDSRRWLIVGALVLIWVPGLRVLAGAWSNVEYASHGFLVPWVALWAATAHREALSQLDPGPLRGGALLLTGCLAVYLGGLALGEASLLGLVAVATVVATVLTLWGLAYAKLLRFPLAYLLFMVPLPSSWVTPLIVELQLLVSGFAVQLLHLLGVTILKQGNVLVLPGDRMLFVAEACSGITSLITLLPIGVFVAYFTEHALWRQIALVAAVVPIALAGNLLRVLMTVWLSIEVSVEFATEGPLHEWAGVLTYALGCICLLGVGRGLRWVSRGRQTARSVAR